MVENKAVLYAAVFIVVILTIIYIIFVVFNVNKQKRGEIVSDTTFDSMIWMGVVLIIAMSLILIWLIAVFFMGDSAIVTASNIVVGASQNGNMYQVVPKSTPPTPTQQPSTQYVQQPQPAQYVQQPARYVQQKQPISVTGNSIQQKTLDAIIASQTNNPL